MGLFRTREKIERNKEYSDRELYSRYLKRIFPFKKSVILISFFILTSTIIDIIIPLIFGFAVDEFEKPNTSFDLILFSGILYLILTTTLWIMFSARRREVGNFTPYFLEDLRMEIFDKLQEQDLSFFDKQLSGGLNSRVSNDAMDFSNTTLLITDNLGNFLVSFITFGILFWLNPVLALITLAGIPILFVLMFSLRRLARVVSRNYRKSIGKINAAMVESIEGIQVCKSYGQEATVSDKFNKTNKSYFSTAYRLTAVTHVWRAVLDSITALILVVIIYLGGEFIIQGKTDTATVLMFILYIQRFFRPIISLATFFPELSAGMAAYERILEILDSEPKIKQNTEFLVDVGEIEGEIIFKNVDFSYNEGENVFTNFNLAIKKGEKIAIVGHTGSGKSSLVKLIARYYEFQGGSIFIDGINIRDLNLKSYRKNIGMVQQDVFLFSGSIADNIRYGRRNLSEEEMQNAIKAVNVDEIIEYLENGIHFKVGERGRGLSAGQKQLISFARAIATQPKILILDEATASVDAYTEAIIQEGLDALLSNRTSIIIAHRLSTILKADRIIVMEQGKIIEEGTHDSLIIKNGKYSQLYKQYYEHQSIDWKPTNFETIKN